MAISAAEPQGASSKDGGVPVAIRWRWCTLAVPATVILVFALTVWLWSQKVDFSWYRELLLSDAPRDLSQSAQIKQVLTRKVVALSLLANLAVSYLIATIGLSGYYYLVSRVVKSSTTLSMWVWVVCFSFCGDLAVAFGECLATAFSNHRDILPWTLTPLTSAWWLGPGAPLRSISALSTITAGTATAIGLQALSVKRLCNSSAWLAALCAAVPYIVGCGPRLGSVLLGR